MSRIAQALVLQGSRRFAHQSFPLPPVGATDGLLRIEACGLCGTDHEQYTGHISSAHAFIPGHEVIGVIESVGDRAAARWGVSEGDRVAVEVFQSCRDCDACRAGIYRRCVRNGMKTMVGFVDVDQPPSLFGGYATHLYLGPDAMLIPVPETLDPVTASLFNPLGAGIRWAAELPGTREGDVVAILGPGVRGLCAAVAAKEAGARFVMITGFGERDRNRLAIASAFGADLAVDVSVDDPVKALRSAVGALADVVVDVTAKAPTAFAQAIRLAKTGGTVVVAGTRGGGGTPGFDPDHVVYKELRILGALGVDADAYRSALALLSTGRYPFDRIPREVVGFGGLESLLQTMAGESALAISPPVHGVFRPDA